MKQLQRRLAALERRLMPRDANPLVLEIRGGLHNGDPTFADAGAMHWERAPNELYTAFCERVVGEATAAAQPFIIIGGLGETWAEADKPTRSVTDSIEAILNNERGNQAP